MKDQGFKDPELLIKEEDLHRALKDMRTYIDITEEDLERIFALALEYAKKRVKSRILVQDIMNTRPIAVKKDTRVKEILEIFMDRRISGVPVVDEESKVVGIVTEADLIFKSKRGQIRGLRGFLRRLLGEESSKDFRIDLTELKAEEIMSSPVHTATPEMDLEEACSLMANKGLKRLPVIDKDGRLVGIISRQDVVSSLARGR